MPAGRPQAYDRKAVLNYISTEMAKGTRSLEDICKDDAMPCVESIYLWVTEDTEEGRELFKIFTHAQGLWCWAQKEQIMKICDDESRDYYVDDKGIRRSDNTAVNRDRLRVQTRQWAMNKLLSKIFGDKVTQEHTGEDGGPIKYSQVVDKPPKETPEQWQARVQKQLEEKARQVIQ